MLQITGIIGNNNPYSYNRFLLQTLQQRYADKLSLTLIGIEDLPFFNLATAKPEPKNVTAFSEQIKSSDGVIIATPEYNHSIPGSLKNALDWCSRGVRPFKDKPVLIIGAALGNMGTVRAQAHLRQILDSPGLNAHVLFGNEFLLSNVDQKFNPNHELVDLDSLTFLDQVINEYIEFVHLDQRSHSTHLN